MNVLSIRSGICEVKVKKLTAVRVPALEIKLYTQR